VVACGQIGRAYSRPTINECLNVRHHPASWRVFVRLKQRLHGAAKLIALQVEAPDTMHEVGSPATVRLEYQRGVGNVSHVDCSRTLASYFLIHAEKEPKRWQMLSHGDCRDNAAFIVPAHADLMRMLCVHSVEPAPESLKRQVSGDVVHRVEVRD
jgi:hypothetical protein